MQIASSAKFRTYSFCSSDSITLTLITGIPMRKLPLIRCVKLRVAHAPGMARMLSPPPRVRDPGMHQSTCVIHVPWCMPRSLTLGFIWSQWRGKCSQHSRRMRNPQFCVSGKRPMAACLSAGSNNMRSSAVVCHPAWTTAADRVLIRVDEGRVLPPLLYKLFPE